MTNLDVLRAVQHAWPSYVWPFANGPQGTTYSLGSSPSPPNMGESKMTENTPSNRGRRPRSHSQRSHEEQILKMENSTSPTRHKNSDVKSERLSPDSAHCDFSKIKRHDSSTPSPSTSPKSQNSHRTRTPASFPATPPHPAFTPPITLPPGCFSPASLAGLGAVPGVPPSIGALTRAPNFAEPTLPRNCSDLMRSLAAKYNNNNNNTLDLYNKGFQKSHVNVPTSTLPNHTIHVDHSQESIKSPHRIPPPPLLPTNTAFSMVSPNPLKSLSSTQALLDMVRNASSNNKSNSPSPSHQEKEEQSRLEVHNSYNNTINCNKRSAESSSSPLDLSASVSAKRMRLDSFVDPQSNVDNNGIDRLSSMVDSSATDSGSQQLPQQHQQQMSSPSSANILNWSVEEVCAFVSSIDLCAEYAEVFREQRIDGWCISLLTENHLTSTLKMKLGPALKLKSILSTKVSQPNSPCSSCHNHLHDQNINRESSPFNQSPDKSSIHSDSRGSPHLQIASERSSPLTM